MSKADDMLARFPDLFAHDDVLGHILEVLGHEFDQAEAALMGVMRAHWVDTTDNEKNNAGVGDMDQVLALFLDVLGGTSLMGQKDRPTGEAGRDSDAVYRTRMKGLIRMLTTGASTVAGIIDIVAANLGIVDDTPEARAARESIRIEEFSPTPVITPVQVALLEPFSMENPNPDATGARIRLSFQVPGHVPLTRLTVHNTTNDTQVVFPGMLEPGETLVFFAAHSSGLHEGVSVTTEGGLVFPPGVSELRVSAKVGYPQVRVDQSLFDFSLFEDQSLEEPTSEQAANFAVHLEVTVDRLFPGSFRVRIPWDIPGFTEKLDSAKDDARSRIKYIVDRIKAAGVHAQIIHEKRLFEDLDMVSQFRGHLRRTPFPESQEQDEFNFDLESRQSAVEEHESSDTLHLGGAFDFTRFDSLNGFNK